MGRPSRYTDAELAVAVAASSSYRQVLRSLGMYEQGGSYKQLKKRLAMASHIDASHFLGQRHGTSIPRRKRATDEMLREGSHIESSRLKKRLLDEGLVKNECGECGISEWRGTALTLHLDHRNGVNTDNRLLNLRLLCPNCHSQTETYCRGTRRRATQMCIDCGKAVTLRYKRCKQCAGMRLRGSKAKIIWPPLHRLEQEVRDTGYVAVGRRLGVSDNAVAKHLELHGMRVRKYKPRSAGFAVR
jgi:hypothetical protein